MELQTALFILFASLGWTAVDASKKVLSEKMPNLPVVVYLAFGQMFLFAVWASFYGKPTFVIEYFYPALGSILINIAANVMFMRSVTLSPFIATVPLLSLSPFFSTLFGFMLLREIPLFKQIIGALIVVGGALILNLRLAEGINGIWNGIRKEKGSLWMIGVAAAFSLGSIFDKAAIQLLNPAHHGIIQCGGIALGLFTLIAIQGNLAGLKSGKKFIPQLCLATLFSATALAFQLLASQRVIMGVYESLKTVAFLIFTIIIGKFFFKEEINKRKMLACVLMGLETIFILK